MVLCTSSLLLEFSFDPSVTCLLVKCFFSSDYYFFLVVVSKLIRYIHLDSLRVILRKISVYCLASQITTLMEDRDCFWNTLTLFAF